MVLKRKVTTNAPPVQITEVSELPSLMAALIYGRSGTGKTTIASTFPKPLLLLDIREKGFDSISNVKGVDIAQLTTWDEFEEVYWYLKAGDTKYRTIIVDQISQLQDLAILRAMKDAGKEPDDAIAQRNWGQAAGLMKTWLLNYRDLIDIGINVVFLAHDRTTDSDTETDDRLDPSVGARIMPSVASFVNGAVKIIGNTLIRESFSVEGNKKKRKVEFAMRIGPHAIYTTKTRSPVGIESPEVIVNPTYDKIVAVVKGEYREEESATKKPILKRKA